MYVINPHGRKVSITPEMWEELKHKGFKLVEEKKKKYTKEYLEGLKWQELRDLAGDEGIKIYGKTKEELIKALLKLEG